MATRKAVIRAAVDSIKPLHLRKVCALGGRAPAWGSDLTVPGPETTATSIASSPNLLGRRVAPLAGGGRRSGSAAPRAVRDSLVGPSRASLVQGGRPVPSLVQAGRRPAPSLVQGGTAGINGAQPPSSASNTNANRNIPKLNGVPVNKPHYNPTTQSRASLVNGRRSTLNGVVKLANGQRVDGAQPAYLIRHTNLSRGSRYNVNAASASASPSANRQSGAIVTDLSSEDGSGDNDNGSKEGAHESDLVVVLDMDECLIHSQFLSQQARSFSAPELGSGDDSEDENDVGPTKEMEDKYRQPDIRPTKSTAFHTDEEAESIIASNCEYFRMHLPDGDLVHVNKRPNLDLFLREVTARFETHIFTAAMEVYANPLLDRLESDLGTTFSGRFYREHCVLDPDLGVYVKDLGLILDKGRESGSDWGSVYDDENENCNGDTAADDSNPASPSSFNERRVVLVDNNPLSFLANPSNGILVSNFYDDPKDATLEAVMELLQELDQAEDVRPVLESKFGLKDALRDVARSTGSWR